MKKWIVFFLLIAAAAAGAIYLIGPESFFGKRPRMQNVDLYYYNKEKDTGAGGQLRCSPASVLPVERKIAGKKPVRETLELLLKGELKDEEKAAGFQTEFPHPDFRLKSVDFDKDSGRLSIYFTRVPGFTSGGSCRTGLLHAQIKKTAGQFAGVSRVLIRPETLFQP